MAATFLNVLKYQKAYTNYIARLHYYPIMKETKQSVVTFNSRYPGKLTTHTTTAEEIAQNQELQHTNIYKQIHQTNVKKVEEEQRRDKESARLDTIPRTVRHRVPSRLMLCV